MIFILMGLGVIGLYFAIRFFALQESIKKSNENLKEVLKDLEANRRVRIVVPNKKMEEFLETVNEYLEVAQNERIHHLRKEQEFKRQIENVSHDLRTPLTAVLGYINLIDLDTLKQDEKEYIEIIKKKAKALQRLISHFYDLSRLESSNYQLNFIEIDIKKYLREILLTYYQEFENRHIDVNLELEENAVLAKLDEEALERILTNLIQNAIKYAESDLKITLTQGNNRIQIVFENDSSELCEEDIGHLFERFYRKDSSRNSQSTGLGLTITQYLVEAMGGKIKAELLNQRLRISIIF
ncbi:sensor histidine kinase [Anaerosacchariphilus polymeriproducens]|uniref:histidine kinase n=1 Tax=Anaerosacchariphilus polymeriproducens TaxID=1812858 RepID=A0A371AQW3_9FIRM|nr:HAMP domain-containing sensor histidine kinase [Anaerosacchariphilus polymeriproducens]RDU21977.1 sensor histidine kinase [Anaerosacchariphilus polymeriproducens]